MILPGTPILIGGQEIGVITSWEVSERPTGKVLEIGISAPYHIPGRTRGELTVNSFWMSPHLEDLLNGTAVQLNPHSDLDFTAQGDMLSPEDFYGVNRADLDRES